MGDLNNVQIGSVVLNMVENVPSYISGATLWNIVDNERLFAEQFTGESIGTSINEKYQPSIISLSIASVLRMMELQGTDTSNIKLGEFSISKGANSSSMSVSDTVREDGLVKLKALGTDYSFYKALG